MCFGIYLCRFPLMDFEPRRLGIIAQEADIDDRDS